MDTIGTAGKPGGIYVSNGTDRGSTFICRLYTTGGEGVGMGLWDAMSVLAILLRAHRDDPVFLAEVERAGFRIEWEE